MAAASPRWEGKGSVPHVLFHWIPGGRQAGRGPFGDGPARPVRARSVLAPSAAACSAERATPPAAGGEGAAGGGRERGAHARGGRGPVSILGGRGLRAAVTGKGGRRLQPWWRGWPWLGWPWLGVPRWAVPGVSCSAGSAVAVRECRVAASLSSPSGCGEPGLCAAPG